MTTQQIKDHINERLQFVNQQIEWYDDEEQNYAEEMQLRFLYAKHELEEILEFIEKKEKESK